MKKLDLGDIRTIEKQEPGLMGKVLEHLDESTEDRFHSDGFREALKAARGGRIDALRVFHASLLEEKLAGLLGEMRQEDSVRDRTGMDHISGRF